MADVALVAHRVVEGDGEGRVMLELARALVARHHAVTVYSCALDPALRGVVVHVPLPHPPGPQPLLDICFFLAGRVRMRGARHDLICTKGACVMPPLPFVYYASFCHAGWRRTWTAQSRPGLYHRAHNRTHVALEARVWPRAERVLAVSSRIGDELGVPPEKLSVVPNGVDLSDFPSQVSDHERTTARAHFGLREDQRVVAFIGEYATGRKGLDTLVAAVADGDEHLLVAGNGPQDSIAALADRSGAGGRVHLLGYTDPRRVLAAADVLAAPSRYEPFSNAATEAAASGLPLVLSTQVGAAEFLGSGALLVDGAGQPAAWRAALDQLRDPGRRSELGAAARAAAERLDWSVTAGAAADVVAAVAERV